MNKHVARKAQELRSDQYSKSECVRCGAPVLRGWTGRVAAVLAEVDPEPVDYDTACQSSSIGLTAWCLVPRRILWWDHGHCDHAKVVDHRCESDKTQLVTLREMVRGWDAKKNQSS